MRLTRLRGLQFPDPAEENTGDVRGVQWTPIGRAQHLAHSLSRRNEGGNDQDRVFQRQGYGV
jgi:hypothetical protein